MSQKSNFSIQSISKKLAGRGIVFTSTLAGVGLILSLSIISPGVLVASSDLISICKKLFQGLTSSVKAEAYTLPGCMNVNLATSTCNTPWYNEINSTVKITRNDGKVYASGNIVNNTQEDGALYILTANHLKYDLDSVSTWKIYPRQASCDGLSSVYSNNYFTGAVEVAATNDTRHDYGDMMLIKINNVPYSTLQSYKISLAGWSRETDSNSINANYTTFLLHHPNNSEKRISVKNDHAIASQNQYNWFVGTWNQGSAADGSSGGGFYLSNDKIIGVTSTTLTGAPEDCSENDTTLGKFGVVWNDNSQLRQALNPSGSNPFDLDYRATYDFNLTNYNFNNPNTNWAGGKFYTLENINAGSGVHVSKDGKLDLKAKKSLVLDTGFTADEGSFVTAEVR
jgi:hypothetical protein